MASSATKTDQFSLVILPTLWCDAACDYCFEQPRDAVMGPELLSLVYRRLEDHLRTTPVRRLHVYWQGGEILTLPPRFMADALERARLLETRGAGIVEQHLQTNLLAYGPAWRDIIAEHFGGRVSTSLDYPNVHRRTRRLGPVEYTSRWMDRKHAAEADGFTVSVVSIPNAQTLRVGAAEFHGYFAEVAGVRNVQVNLPFPGSGRPYPLPVDVGSMTRFFIDLYRVWRESGRILNLNPFAVLERRVAGDSRELPCALSYCCAQDILAVGPDGEVAQCDCWLAGREGFSYGSLLASPLSEILESAARARFLSRPVKVFAQTECGACAYWRLCHGGCPVRAHAFTGSLDARDHYCALYRTLLEEVVKCA